MQENDNAHDPQYYEAGRVIKSLPSSQSTQLFKTTRSGATTGLCANGFDNGMKVTLIAPNIVIATDTLEMSKRFSDIDENKIVRTNIPGNKRCIKIQNEIKKNPDLDYLPMIPLPMKCDDCSLFGECEVTEFLRADDPHCVGMTHQKLNALMHSSSDTAVRIVDKLMSMSDLVIIDEAHELETSNASTVCVYPIPDMDKYEGVRNKYSAVCEFLDRFDTIRNDNNESVIQHLVDYGEKSTETRMATNINCFDGDEDEDGVPEFSKTVSAIKDIVNIMKHRSEWGLEIKDVVYLNDIVMTMSGSSLVIHYIREDDMDIVQLSSPGSVQNAVREYVMRCITYSECKIVFTSATFGDFYYGNMFGMNTNKEVMKDTRNTNALMTIHPDTYRISTQDYWREEGHANKPRIIKDVKKYADKYGNIRFMCMKKSVAHDLKKWMKEDGYDIDVDYYRSTRTLGVSCDARRMVCVGAPVTAINAFDGVSKEYDESQKMRVNANHAAFWQAVSRIKDPDGEEESHVYCIGIREDEIRMMCTWGINRTINIDGIKCMSVKVDCNNDDDKIGMPNIERITQQRIEKAISKNGEMTRSNIMRKLKLPSNDVVNGLSILIDNGIISSRVSNAKRHPVLFFKL